MKRSPILATIVILYCALLAAAPRHEWNESRPNIPAPRIIELEPPQTVHTAAMQDLANTFTAANTFSGNNTFTGTNTFAAVTSASANPAQNGIVRLASGDAILWRNGANTQDVGIGHIGGAIGNVPADAISNVGIPGILYFNAMIPSTSTAVAASGSIRLASGDTINWRNNSNSADISLTKSINDSLVYNNFVMPQLVALVNSTGLSANVAQTTLYAVPANGTGMYRISAYIVETTAAGTSSTLPQVLIAWTDNDSSFANTSAPNAWTATNTGNTVGAVGNMATNTSAVLAPAGFVVNAKASTNILYSTSSYFSNPAAAMQYALHLKVEYLGQ